MRHTAAHGPDTKEVGNGFPKMFEVCTTESPQFCGMTASEAYVHIHIHIQLHLFHA